LKIEATCTPGAPAPITSSDSGTDERRHASLWVQVKSNPGNASRRDASPVQMMAFADRSRGAFSLSTTRGSTSRAMPACS
jgi:hypothetical protein